MILVGGSVLLGIFFWSLYLCYWFYVCVQSFLYGEKTSRNVCHFLQYNFFVQYDCQKKKLHLFV